MVKAAPAPEEALLRLLLELDEGQGVSLPRLAKRLDERVSVLLRQCSALSAATIGGVAGPGWVQLQCDETGRWVAWLTPTGRAALEGA